MRESTFIKDGFKRWKKAVECFRKHEQSVDHRHCVVKFEAIKQGTNVLAQLNTKHESEREVASQCLLKIFTTIRFLARQGLPLRGHHNAQSNVNQFINLRSEDFSELKAWLTRKTTWTTAEIQDEMIKEMADAVLRGIIDEIKQRQIYCLLADETADISQVEQMCICFRTVTGNLLVSIVWTDLMLKVFFPQSKMCFFDLI